MNLDQYPVKSEDFDGPVLVTGAGGCIGAWVLALLERAGVPIVAFDLSKDKRRPKLLMPDEAVDALTWETGDIADSDRVMSIVREHGVRAIIHLAALQVPFCKADPINGAKVNVVGTVNVFEAARAHSLKRLAFASSIAAHSFLPDQNWLPTLYGAYKYCDEMIAKVYSQDFGVPSVGIRPGVVYGIGRDQGMTSKTTIAILAAAAGQALHDPVFGRRLRPTCWRGRERLHQGGVGRPRRSPDVRPQRRADDGGGMAGHDSEDSAGRQAFGGRERSPIPRRALR